MTSLQVNGVGAGYGRHRVFDNVEFDLADGEMLAVLGPSGCGKTTLLRSIAGLHRLDSGSIVLHGDTIARAPSIHVAPEHRGIGLMPQEGGLFPHLDVGRNIAFGLVKPLGKRRRGDRGRIRRRVREMLNLVGLPDAIAARPAELSGGQQQRVALARALAPRPGLVLLDEPFASLDAGLRAALRTDVRDLLRRTGTPSILVTHDRIEALTTADRMIVLLDGRSTRTATPREIYRRPPTPAVGAFVGEAVIVDASRSGEGATTIFGNVVVSYGAPGPGQVLIRPEQLAVTEDSSGAFVVTASAFSGPDTSVDIKHTVTGTSATALVRNQLPLLPGRRVQVTVHGSATFFPNGSHQGFTTSEDEESFESAPTSG